MPSRPASSSPLFAQIGFAVAVSVALVVYLYGILPYAAGYGAERVTMLHYANVLWKLEGWSHCAFVPFAVAFVIYVDRRHLASIAVSGSTAGLLVLALAFLTYWAGYRADNVYLGYASLQILLAGLILWFLGWRWMFALSFAWAFLVFMYPLVFLDNIVAFPLRLVMSETSTQFLNLVGIPAIKSGSAILSAPDPVIGLASGKRFQVDVADPCSGIRSLFALMMVTALYGHLTLRSVWQKVVLFICSAPLAILGNFVRILMLTLGTIALGPDIAIGTLEQPSFIHMFSGYAVFVVAIAGMIAIAWLLQRDWSRVGDSSRAASEPPVFTPVSRPDRNEDIY